MQKRSHKLLASTLMNSYDGFEKRRFELAFLFGSFQPDCNPLSYLKGSFRGKKFMGHNYSNSEPYIGRHINRLQRREKWTVWQYYTLGKLTHYLADAFTFPHNDTYPDSLAAHHRYEDALRSHLLTYLRECSVSPAASREDVMAAIDRLHRQYLTTVSDWQRDIQYILQANGILMAGLLPRGTPAMA